MTVIFKIFGARFARKMPCSDSMTSLQFLSYFSDVIEAEIKRLQHDFRTLEPYHWDDDITVNVTAKLSMIDGKIRNQLTGNPASQRCSFCHLLPADYLDKNRKPIKHFSTSMNALWCFQELCISPLHCCLRIFEALHRIGYLQDVKKGRVSKHTRAKVNERKQQIQKEFKKKGMKIGKFYSECNLLKKYS